MNKPKRENLRYLVADSIKPPAFKLDETGSENHTYKCVYVTDARQVTHKCTHNVWKRCEGTQRAGRPRNGLCDTLGSKFVIWIDGSKNTDVERPHERGIVVDIDVIPDTYYQLRQTMPEEMAEQSTIDVSILPSGAVQVDSIPAGVNEKTVINLITGLNKLDEVNAGDVIPGGFDVEAVNGNKIQVLPPVRR